MAVRSTELYAEEHPLQRVPPLSLAKNVQAMHNMLAQLGRRSQFRGHIGFINLELMMDGAKHRWKIKKLKI